VFFPSELGRLLWVGLQLLSISNSGVLWDGIAASLPDSVKSCAARSVVRNLCLCLPAPCDAPVCQVPGTDLLASSCRTEPLFQPGKWWKEGKHTSRPRKKADPSSLDLVVFFYFSCLGNSCKYFPNKIFGTGWLTTVLFKSCWSFETAARCAGAHTAQVVAARQRLRWLARARLCSSAGDAPAPTAAASALGPCFAELAVGIKPWWRQKRELSPVWGWKHFSFVPTGSDSSVYLRHRGDPFSPEAFPHRGVAALVGPATVFTVAWQDPVTCRPWYQFALAQETLRVP